MKYLLFPFLFLIIGCSNAVDPLDVRIHFIRDENTDRAEDPMVRHEKLRRLYGAVSMEERGQRLGQYYTVIWNADASLEKEILFEYQQGGSASLIKTMRKEIEPGQASGKETFSVIGDNYFENGKVIAWKTSLIVGGETLATEQSYLWE